MKDLSAYRDIFIDELNEQLGRMDQSLVMMESTPSPEQLQILFRAAHTIKGSSAAMNFRELTNLTHEVEYALEWLRGNHWRSSEWMDILFQVLDAMMHLRDQYVKNEPCTDYSTLGSEIKNRIGRMGTQPVVHGTSQTTAADTELQDKARNALAAGRTVLSLHIILSDGCEMKEARYHIIRNRLLEENDEILTVLGLAEDKCGIEEDEKYSRFVLVICTAREASQVQAQLEKELEIASVKVEAFPLEQETASLAGPAEREEAPSEEEQGKPSQATVRVNVERLEHLMNLVGELLIDQTSLVALSTDGQRKDPAEMLRSIGGVSDHMGQVIKELQEGVMKTRMLPIDQLFSRFPRMVRDLSRKLDKELELVIVGGETELDRMIIEELSDPLIHLIRNSADHGIESPEVRAAGGKPAKGRITLTSFHEENHVVISIEDDGQGIDAARVTALALAKGIITEEQADRLTPQEAVKLIFEPGFSTAAAVSEVSGRGVGMDIVRSQIGQLNGLIDIHTVPGEGTRFTIRLPLTLAIIKGLLVKVSGRLMVIPMYNIAEIVRITPAEIQTIQGERVFINHGQVVPFFWLHDKLQYPRTKRELKTIPLVIVRSVERSIAFAVDEIVGNQEIVIKSLGQMLGQLNHLSGATILGNGQVAVILDASYLVAH